MMNCLTARRALLAEPGASDPDLSRHLRECPHCCALARTLAEDEAALRAAIDIPVPDHLQDRILLQTALRRRTSGFDWLTRHSAWLSGARGGALALACSLALAVGIWQLQPAHDPHLNWSEVVLAHVIGEPDAVGATASLPGARLSAALGRHGLALGARLGTIRFIEHCPVPGGRGTHIVIDTERLGKVSLILPPPGVRVAASAARGDGYAAATVDIAGVSVGIVTSEPDKLKALSALLAQAITRQA